MLALPTYLLIFISIGLLAYAGAPFIFERWLTLHKKISEQSAVQSEEARLEKKYVTFLYVASPVVLGFLAWFIFQKVPGVVFAVLISFTVPSLVLKMMVARRQGKFVQQLIDGLMILSSSLKGGLSFLQSLEVLCEEMPAPITEEFSWVLREIKMGVSLEEALNKLNKRMPSEELELIISSVLVSRETGGDLTKVFSRLVSTIRERAKLKEAIATYTLQGKIQGIVMSLLPVAFYIWVQKVNPQHFEVMWQSNLGRMLLIVAAALEVAALILIKKFSTIKV